ncbi:zinc fingers and homeoboxes protein 3 isoform X1 [Ascaphus truei]|uniref:zinc fingers and homeoboxes protein 3 isoform X1 n=1 Tax=Ascaphus truei TaxID=8439 RepID=UPI003F5A183B
MASKRKSTTPCMIPLKTLAVGTGADNVDDFKEKDPKEESPEMLSVSNIIPSHNEMQPNGHQNVDGKSFFCKYCNFGSHDTSTFVEHMDTKHLDFREDPSYVCIACSFLVKEPKELEAHNAECHCGDASLTWSVAKHESYTVVEQSICDNGISIDLEKEHQDESVNDYSEITVTKTPIMKSIKNKAETKKILTMKDNICQVVKEGDKKSHLVLNNGPISVNKSISNTVTASPINGSIISNVPMLQAGVTQLVSINAQHSVLQPKFASVPSLVTPILAKPSVIQKPQYLQHNHQLPTAKSLPKVMIPLSSIPTYNAAMDSNCFLKNNFTKFPYPTKAELCYLTVVTKYPEEQIKIWFTAQRLKQGISWSPEEIEDSRKKMFNTVIQSIPQPMPQPTITVLNAPLVTNANFRHLFQAALPGQIVGQPQGAGGLLVTQPIITNGIQGAGTSIALTMTPIPTQHTTTFARVTSSPRTVITTAPSLMTPSASTLSQSWCDTNLSRCKKSRHQLSTLKNSFYKNQFPSHVEVARLTKSTGLTTRDVRKWFSDKRYHWRNKTVFGAEKNDQLIDSGAEMTFTMLKDPEINYTLPTTVQSTPHTPRRQSWHQTPDFTPTKYKERAPEQIRALESSFFQNNFPSEEEVNRLRTETKMTRREIDGWFSEKRKKTAEEKKAAVVDQEEDDDDSGDELKASGDDGSTNTESSQTSAERKVNPIKINLKDLRVTESNDHTEMAEDHESSPATEGDSRPSSPLKNRQYYKKTAQQRDLLKQIFIQTQWPSNPEYDDLVEQTGLPRADVVRWFGDCRYSFKNGQLKWYDRYKKGTPDMKPHRSVGDPDLEGGTGEKTGVSADEVNVLFAGKLEEENQAVSDTGSEDQLSSCGDRPGSQKGTYDGFSEVSESSECWEPGAQEAGSDALQALNPQSSIQLEAD